MLMAVLLLSVVYLISQRGAVMVSGQNVVAGRKRPVVVIDSGHGTSHLCKL